MATSILDREEYVEQAYFFRTYLERLNSDATAQDILSSIHEEILSTTKLPIALEFLSGEIQLNGRMSEGMQRLAHYFTAFQTYVMRCSEEDTSSFDHRIALQILASEAEYRTSGPTPAGLFVFQFECLARNRLGYDQGIEAMAADPVYDEHWSEWIRKIRRVLGTTDFGDMIYLRSEQYVLDSRRHLQNPDFEADWPILFGQKEGRIAKANRGKDPLYMFAALQRQLGYPQVPRPKPRDDKPVLHPALEQRLQRIEKHMQLIDMDLKGGIDLSKFYVKPPSSEDDRPGDQQRGTRR